ncbi:MAG: quinone-dependent dihydroorotate dehydrogenase [Granulosicoccus sp.]
MLFSLARSVLFELDPERAHDLSLSMMDQPLMQRWLARRYQTRNSMPAQNAVECMGLQFDNRIGLAAGLDKNGDHIDALGALGFGFLEVGTVTPRAQAGNSKPRLFRLSAHGALINRFGFNNKGVDHLVNRVEQRTWRGRLGINIGKNATTSLDDAEADYLHCFEKVAALADYVTINISSPNTQGLRDLQHGERLTSLLHAMKNAQSQLATRHGKHTPLAVKIAPDMNNAELDTFCAAVLESEIETVIIGNTTNSRSPVAEHLYARETGGMSGAPLQTLANDRLSAVAERLQGRTVLIGVGGVNSGTAAVEKRYRGADLVQLYTGLIFHGPALVRDCVRRTA